MKISSFCLPTFKEVPSDVKLKSHELMIRSGMIRMETSGIYTWLPLGLRVLNKINDIIINEHQKLNINHNTYANNSKCRNLEKVIDTIAMVQKC